MGLLPGVALHVPLEVLLPPESTLAARLHAFELDLLDDGGQVLQTPSKLLLGGLARRLAVWSLHEAVAVDGGKLKFLIVFTSTAGDAAHGGVRARGRTQGNGPDWRRGSLCLEDRQRGWEFRIG